MRSLILLLGTLWLGNATAAPLSWQGRLIDTTGAPLTGSHDVSVQLWDAMSGGSTVGPATDLTMTLDNGYAHITLDNDGSEFLAGDLYIEVAVDTVVLEPRHVIARVPVAMVTDRIRVAASPLGACDSTAQGRVYYDTSDSSLQICVDGSWTPIAGASSGSSCVAGSQPFGAEGINSFTVAAAEGCDTLRFEIQGAGGGATLSPGTGGTGGFVEATVPVSALGGASTLQVVVGGGGEGASCGGGTNGAGGGGLSGVFLDNFTPLAVAGGGAGAGAA